MRLSRSIFSVLVLVVAVSAVGARGLRERTDDEVPGPDRYAEMVVIAGDGLQEGSRVLIVGALATLGNEPHTYLAVRTRRTASTERVVLRIADRNRAELAGLTGRVVRLEGWIIADADGPTPPVLQVDTWDPVRPE